MIDIIIKFFQLLFCMIINSFFHELFHYLSIKLYGQKAVISFGCGDLIFKFYDFELRKNPIVSYVQSFSDIKNPTLFYMSGMISNLLLGIIGFVIFHQFDWFWKYSFYVFLCNLIIIFPGSDIYKCLNINKRVKLSENAESNWNIIGFLLSILSLIVCIIYFFVFY